MKRNILFVLLAVVLVSALVFSSMGYQKSSGLEQRISKLEQSMKPRAEGDNVYQAATVASNGIGYYTNAAQGLLGTNANFTIDPVTGQIDTHGVAPDAPTGRGATCVIAASDATALEKAQADVVCTGTDDNETILAKAVALSPTGGKIHLSSGHFYFSMGFGRSDNTEGISNNLIIEGSGESTVISVKNQAATTLTAQANAGQKILTVVSTSGFVVGEWIEIAVSGGPIVGNEDSGYIASIDSPTQLTLETNLTFTHIIGVDVFSTWCTFDLGTKSYITLKDFSIDGNTANWTKATVLGCRHQYEVQIGGNVGSDHCTVDNITIIHGRRIGVIIVLSSYCKAINCHSDSSLGIEGTSSYLCSVENCTVANYTEGLFLENAHKSALLNNYLYGCGIIVTESSKPSTHCRIDGNIIEYGQATHGGMYLAGLKDSSVTNNIIRLYSCPYNAYAGGIYITAAERVLLASNILDTVGGAGVVDVPAFNLGTATDCVLDSNSVNGTWRANRAVYVQVSGWRIQNNNFSTLDVVLAAYPLSIYIINNILGTITSSSAAGFLNTVIINNKGFIGPGEIRTISKAITKTGTALVQTAPAVYTESGTPLKPGSNTLHCTTAGDAVLTLPVGSTGTITSGDATISVPASGLLVGGANAVTCSNVGAGAHDFNVTINAIAFSIQCPELQNCLITRVELDITTVGGTATSTIAVGTANDATGTGVGTEFFTAIDANAAALRDSYLAGDTGTQTKYVVWNYTGNDDYIIGTYATEIANNLVGKVLVTYMGR